MEIFHHSRLTEALTAYTPLTTQFYTQMGHYNSKFTPAVVNRILDQQVEQQAFMLSTNDLSILGAWMFILLIPLIFLCKPIKPVAGHVEAVH